MEKQLFVTFYVLYHVFYPEDDPLWSKNVELYITYIVMLTASLYL